MDEKWAAYRDAVIRLETPGAVVWVRPAPATWTGGAYPDLEGRVICVITAHNPAGRTVSEDENAKEQERPAEPTKTVALERPAALATSAAAVETEDEQA